MRTPKGLAPDFIIIGAMKSGTTSLDRHLRAHPEVGMSRDKETDYFVAEKAFANGAAWYAGQFDPAFRVHGEASPNYTKLDVFKGVPERIRAAHPTVKLVYIVRDPVKRAISQYVHSWTIGDIAMTPSQFVDSHEWQHVVTTSRYALQIRPFLEYFDRERILFLDFDDLVAAPQATMDTMFRFIEVAPHTVDTGSHNDSAELSKVPPAILRLAQTRFGRSMNRVVSRKLRDRIRRSMARSAPRTPPEFPGWAVDRLKGDLAEDAREFRVITGQAFERWSV